MKRTNIIRSTINAASRRGRRPSLAENVPCISDFARARLFLNLEKTFSARLLAKRGAAKSISIKTNHI